MLNIGYPVIIGRLLLSVAVGLLLGVERERSHKPAGMRTHVLVCLNACIIAMISVHGFAGLGANNDPARLVVGILQGVGFLGAGIIWKDTSGSIVGITTAAEIFLLTALGISCGMGLYFLTLVATLITYLTLSGHHLQSFVCRRLHLSRYICGSVLCRRCNRCGTEK